MLLFSVGNRENSFRQDAVSCFRLRMHNSETTRNAFTQKPLNRQELITVLKMLPEQCFGWGELVGNWIEYLPISGFSEYHVNAVVLAEL